MKKAIKFLMAGACFGASSTYALPPMTVTQTNATTQDFSTVAVVINNDLDAVYSGIPNQGQYVYSRLYDGPSLGTRVETLNNFYATSIDSDFVYGYDNYYNPSSIVKCNMSDFPLETLNADALSSSNCATLGAFTPYLYGNTTVGFNWYGVVRYGNSHGAILTESGGDLPDVALPSGAIATLATPPTFTVTPGTLVTPINSIDHSILLSMYPNELYQDKATTEYVWYSTPNSTPIEINLAEPIAILATNEAGQSIATSSYPGANVLSSNIDLLLCDINGNPPAQSNDCDTPITVSLPNATSFYPQISSNGMVVVHTQRPTSGGIGVAFDGVLLDYNNPADSMTAWEILGESAPADNTMYTMGGTESGTHFYINKQEFISPTEWLGTVYQVSFDAPPPDNYDVTLTYIPAGQWKESNDIFIANAAIEGGMGPFQSRFVINQLTPVKQQIFNSGWVPETQQIIDISNLGLSAGSSYNLTVITRDQGSNHRQVRAIKRLNIQ